ERTDLLDDLLAMAGEPDPYFATARNADGSTEMFRREIVRVNHLKNCLLCHPAAAPEDRITRRRDVLDKPPSGRVPEPRVQIPVEYYSSPGDGIFVRADITYLRQDFSVRLPVANAHPWPAMQRYDFLVRLRSLTSTEAIRGPAANLAKSPNG